MLRVHADERARAWYEEARAALWLSLCPLCVPVHMVDNLWVCRVCWLRITSFILGESVGPGYIVRPDLHGVQEQEQWTDAFQKASDAVWMSANREQGWDELLNQPGQNNVVQVYFRV